MIPEGDMSGLLAQAQAMQEQLLNAQQELADMEIEGSAGGDLVTATVTGAGELLGLVIKPEAVDPSDTETLADLIVAAVRDATNKAQAVAASKLGPLAGGLGWAADCPSNEFTMYEGPVQDLIDELGRLPGIGPKSAQRLAFHILAADPDDVMRLAAILKKVKDTVKFCEICFNVSEDTQCRICRDPRRDETVICVVEEAKDVVAVERTREFRGRYHVLGGAISPIDGIGPADLKIRELCLRLADGTVTEVILATDPNLEGEATATYLSRLLLPMGVKVSRLASGLPVGGDLEYADEVTLGRAFEGRRYVDA